MNRIPIIEQQFFKLFEKEISVEQFESWIYKQEDHLVKSNSAEYFESLLIINYKSKEAKHELEKLINPNFINLYKNKIANDINKSLQYKCNQIHDVEYVLYYDDLGNSNYHFKIGEIHYVMHSPFKTLNSTRLSEAERAKRFTTKFGNPSIFLNCILESLETENARLYNLKLAENYDIIEDAKYRIASGDEYKLIVERNMIFLKKDYLNNQMKNTWL